MDEQANKPGIRGRRSWMGVALAVALAASVNAHAAYSYTTIDYPGTTGMTGLSGINNSGQIVGTFGPFLGTSGLGTGFLLNAGSFTSINVPAGPLGPAGGAFGINDAGQVVGSYQDSAGHHGFLDTGGSFSTIDAPGAVNTSVMGINDLGQIVGSFEDGAGIYHGFLANGGSFITLDVPGGSATGAAGINMAGQIVGTYQDSAGQFHGFLAAPVPEPGTGILWVAGCVVLAVAARRRQACHASV